MQTLNLYREDFLAFMEEKVRLKEPENLYEPILYMLNLGGKRLRPVLVLLSAEIFGTSYKKAMHAALAIEMFHNFSLIHDDIMDDAPMRRGKISVHEKWDLNTAILSGDAMLIIAYKLFENYEGETFSKLAKLFTDTAIKVCEGQQYDVDFETRDNVSVAEYLHMIEYKTAVLVGAALKMGAIVANASEENTEKIFEFGRLLGIAFQLQDDYLDIFGDEENFGKQIGGDIVENKKTFLFLKAMEQSSKKEASQLLHLYDLMPNDPSEKIGAIKQIFEESGAAEQTRLEIEKFTHLAFEVLNNISIDYSYKEVLKNFGKNLMNRKM
ncbi:MAG TPA: polyprenyl synthetase family protein [Flavobacteriaceae bacterium]|nr:polyprenyl synthetase family protein [Flavobacteriaceae bacterium]